MRHSWQLVAGLFPLLGGCAGVAEPTDAMEGVTLPGSGSGGSGSEMTLAGTSPGGSAGGDNTGGTYADVGGSAGGGLGGVASGGAAGMTGGGNDGLGGSGGSGGSGGGGGVEMKPPGPIDYRMWALQLPTGSGDSPTTIKPEQLLAGFSNDYFYPADDGGQMFMDPVTGVTTSGSTRCRTEMREADPNGGQAAAWSASATNRMTVEGKIVKGGGGNITIGQILNGTDSFPLVEFEWSSSRNGFQLFYEEAKGSGDTIGLNTSWPQNQRYSFTLELSNDKLLVSVNGKQVYSRTPSANMLTKKYYFKFGNYDQNTSAGPASTTPHSIVEAYKVDVVHQ